MTSTHTPQNSYSKEELLACGRGEIFGGSKIGGSWTAACPSSTRYALGGEGEAA